MHNPHIDGFKVTNQIFDICLEAEKIKFKAGLMVVWEGLAFFPAQKMPFYLINLFVACLGTKTILLLDHNLHVWLLMEQFIFLVE